MPEARQMVADVLVASRFDGDADTVLLLASELVTNAVRHAATTFELSVHVGDGTVLVEVTDHDREHPPRLRHPRPTDTTGRGLQIVDEMSTSWGSEPVAGARDAKRVWFRCS